MSERERIARIIEPDAERLIEEAAWAPDRKASRERWAAAIAKADTILSPRGEQTEAVAWRRRARKAGTGAGGEWVLYGPDDADFYNGQTDRYEIEPLYAHPAGAEAPFVADLADAIYRHVEPLLAEYSEPNREDYVAAILAALSPQALGEGHGSSSPKSEDTQPGVDGAVLVPRDLIGFLMGDQPYEGVWFNEAPLTSPGARPQPFWWRHALGKCLAAPSTPTAGDE